MRDVVDDLKILHTVLRQQGGWRTDHIESAITSIEWHRGQLAAKDAEIAQLRGRNQQLQDRLEALAEELDSSRSLIRTQEGVLKELTDEIARLREALGILSDHRAPLGAQYVAAFAREALEEKP